MNSIRNVLENASGADRTAFRLDRDNAGQVTNASLGQEAPRWYQFSRKSALKHSQAEAAEAIRNAIKDYYGAARGSQLLARYRATGKAITTRQLRNIVRDGEHTEEAQVREALGSARRGGQYADRVLFSKIAARYDETRELRETYGAAMREHGMAYHEFLHVVSRGNEVLSQAACSSAEISSLQRDIARVLKQAYGIREGLAAAEKDSFGGAMRMGIEDLVQALETRWDSLEAQWKQIPDSASNVRTAFELQYDAAIRVVKGILLFTNEGDITAEEAAVLERLVLALTNERDARLGGLQGSGPVEARVMEEFKNLPGELSNRLYRELRGVRPNLPRKAYPNLLHEAHVQCLNEQDWKPIERTIQLFHGGKRLVVHSTITPEARMNPTMEAKRGTHGITCSDTASTEAVNVAEVKVSVEAAGGGEKLIFHALRHGVNSAFGKPQGERAAANTNRAQQLYVDVLHMHPDLLARALDGEVVDLPLVSVGLLTPDGIRHDPADEKAYILEQKAAWMAGDEEGVVTLHVLDANGQPRTVMVKPNVAQFNFGVNAGAQAAAFMQFVAGGWGTSTTLNREALQTFIGDVNSREPGGMLGAYLNSGGRSDADKAVAMSLYTQIKQLWTSGAYREKGHDPYRLPARIAVLANHIGVTPAFNCKSGKDRTGQMHVACATLACRMALGLSIDPDQPMTDDDKHLLEEIALNSGNHEMQRLNTGLAGFKTKGVSGLDAQFRPEALPLHRGMSRYVHA